MKDIVTTRFGKIEVDETDVIRFADGIPGFPEEQEFVMIPFGEDEPFIFMQSLSEGDLAFLITNPFVFFEDYEFVLPDEVLNELQIKDITDFATYSILSIPNKNIKEMTANLVAPLVINVHTKQASQVVLEKTSYTTRHRLFDDKKIRLTEGGR